MIHKIGNKSLRPENNQDKLTIVVSSLTGKRILRSHKIVWSFKKIYSLIHESTTKVLFDNHSANNNTLNPVEASDRK